MFFVGSGGFAGGGKNFNVYTIKPPKYVNGTEEINRQAIKMRIDHETRARPST